MEKALTGLVSWVDARLPITRAWDTHMGKYYAPKNFNLWYFFGVFSLLVLVNQLLTGIWLTMSTTLCDQRSDLIRVHINAPNFVPAFQHVQCNGKPH